MEHKQVILIRQDLRLPKGKAAAQAAHAAVEAAFRAERSAVQAWRSMGQKKVVVRVSDEQALYRYVQQAKDSGLPVSVITDAGKTVVAPGTVTAAAIGPADQDAVDSITGDLALF